VMPVITSWTQGAWVALDILLVALIIYQVLVIIRGTRAAPMLVGLVVVSVIFYLARIGELTTLNWVVSHVLPYLVFALIVVFQSEIRHVLADLGRRLTFLGGSSSESDSYDDIVLAANLFSQHHATASHKQVSQRATAKSKSLSSSSEEASESGSEKLAESVKASASKHSGRSAQSQAATTTGKFLSKLV